MIYQAITEPLDFFLRSISAGSSSVAPSNQTAALFLLHLVTDGTTCSCRHRPGLCPCSHYAAATAKKGLTSLGVKWLQTSPALHVPFPANLCVLPCRRAKENHYERHREHHNERTPTQGKTCDLVRNAILTQTGNTASGGPYPYSFPYGKRSPRCPGGRLRLPSACARWR